MNKTCPGLSNHGDKCGPIAANGFNCYRNCATYVTCKQDVCKSFDRSCNLPFSNGGEDCGLRQDGDSLCFHECASPFVCRGRGRAEVGFPAKCRAVLNCVKISAAGEYCGYTFESNEKIDPCMAQCSPGLFCVANTCQLSDVTSVSSNSLPTLTASDANNNSTDENGFSPALLGGLISLAILIVVFACIILVFYVMQRKKKQNRLSSHLSKLENERAVSDVFGIDLPSFRYSPMFKSSNVETPVNRESFEWEPESFSQNGSGN